MAKFLWLWKSCLAKLASKKSPFFHWLWHRGEINPSMDHDGSVSRMCVYIESYFHDTFNFSSRSLSNFYLTFAQWAFSWNFVFRCKTCRVKIIRRKNDILREIIMNCSSKMINNWLAATFQTCLNRTLSITQIQI